MGLYPLPVIFSIGIWLFVFFSTRNVSWIALLLIAVG